MLLIFVVRKTLTIQAIRYGFLLLEDVASQDPLSVSVAILHQFNILPEMYQVGYTKLFFRTGQVSQAVFVSLINTPGLLLYSIHYAATLFALCILLVLTGFHFQNRQVIR